MMVGLQNKGKLRGQPINFNNIHKMEELALIIDDMSNRNCFMTHAWLHDSIVPIYILACI